MYPPCTQPQCACLQISRFNALNQERERKLKAGEPVPELVTDKVRMADIHSIA